MNPSFIFVIAGLLQLTLLLMHGLYIAFAHGVLWGTGRRTTAANLTDLDRRFERTIVNNSESMIAFLPVFVAATMIGPLPKVALLAATIYLAARLAFAVIYLLNVPYIRTAIWFVSVVCIIIIAATTLWNMRSAMA